MKAFAIMALATWVALALAAPAAANTLPNITDVVVTACGDSLHIAYDVSDPDGDTMDVILYVAGSDVTISADAPGVTGDIGPGIESGPGRTISIDAAAAGLGAQGPFVPRLLAYDGTGYGAEMVAVQSVGGPDFLIDRYEVTNQQFAAFMRSDGYERMEFWIIDDGSLDIEETGWNYAGRFRWTAPHHWDPSAEPPWSTDTKSGAASSPVLGISWFECYAYCKWAGHRLPTSSEWHEAAGLREATYPWGDSQSEGQTLPGFELANIKYGHAGYSFGEFSSDGFEFAAPVGYYSPQGDSPLGLADAFGNVWEWCLDAVTVVNYGTYSCATRPLRGGSWATSAAELGKPFKDLCPLYRIDTAGFRCAADAR